MSMFAKEREFIVEERDVTTVLAVINQYLNYRNYMSVGNCGWADEEATKWFIIFDSSDNKYGKIMQDLNEIGEFKVHVRQKGKVDLYFNRFENVSN